MAQMDPRVLSFSPQTDGIGFFGKVPTHGDFVSTGLGRTIENNLANWLQTGMAESEQAFGRNWERMFRDAPPWRFATGGTVWGQVPMVGVLMPSRDRVGRSFPLVIAARLPSFRGHPKRLCDDETWFMAVEALAETTLTRDFDLATFVAGLRRLRMPRSRGTVNGETVVRLPQSVQNSVLFWTGRNPTYRPGSFNSEGTPDSRHFIRLLTEAPRLNPDDEDDLDETEDIDDDDLDDTDETDDSDDGDDEEEDDDEAEEEFEPPARLVPPRPPQPAHELVITRGYATHAGARVQPNADALLISDTPRLLIIADGGGQGAVEAARIATNSLVGVPAHDTLEALVHEVKGKLGRAHMLVQSSHARYTGEPAHASVVALTMCENAFAVVWAGNARCYLVRDGMMRCITRDHVEVGMRYALSRAIGLGQQLVLDTVTDAARDGDRLLLCSAPLTRVLDERAIAATLVELPPRDAATALVQDSLIANIRDNVSAVVVNVRAK